ncbi:MAG: hypothetical protein A3J62_00395 [Candidatus Buchananbacteria bacterium RIFCSPHIGHO2_02_FULL_38_8]|uniref:Bacterial type II secretion system protein E domain-containing protein n=2 Tax=Candidatus Buchananiibacteriota TaxID=1817903 RepID=A0A1G1Y0B5_9BACT|nr:MAG: hypothetical protein A2731_02120 [Candidatus Buchananbacteria bacterium RIFCSPHIGHO2_01_FULL_39_8]OGY47988.1 MAG: hypothetical protein A3J62_00395 [Candidatus Buchananbacteria bacterium RIFCSPHIGHO2_02_FULL_38_8]
MQAALNVTISKILATAAKRKASVIHLTVGAYPVLRIDEELVELEDEQILTEDFMKKFADGILDDNQKKELEKNKEVTFIEEFAGKFRFRINIFYQKGYLSASLKLVSNQIPPLVNLGLPKSVYGLTDKTSGLIIIAGPYGSGRTTTVASMLEEINKNRRENIITIEKPIEYLFVNQKCLIEQREVGRDVNTFIQAIQYFKEADVDVIAVGANEETETIPLVLEFASSGRLAIIQMDTISVIQTLEEILASFEAKDQARAQLLLSEGLLAIICQRLVPRIGSGLALAAEVLIVNDAVRSLIKEGRIKQITTILQSSRAEGMSTLDQSLAELVKSGEVLIDKAANYATNPSNLRAMAK